MRDYMVLSDLAAKPTAPRIRTRALAGPFESFQLSTRSGEPPQPKIEIQGMSPHEVADIRRKPGFAAIAPIMPTSLIQPVSAGAGDTQEVWGLAAVKANTSTFNGEGVIVAVLDTGIDKDHAAFALHLQRR
jgi:subtilisin family serine protease